MQWTTSIQQTSGNNISLVACMWPRELPICSQNSKHRCNFAFCATKTHRVSTVDAAAPRGLERCVGPTVMKQSFSFTALERHLRAPESRRHHYSAMSSGILLLSTTINWYHIRHPANRKVSFVRKQLHTDPRDLRSLWGCLSEVCTL